MGVFSTVNPPIPILILIPPAQEDATDTRVRTVPAAEEEVQPPEPVCELHQGKWSLSLTTP